MFAEKEPAQLALLTFRFDAVAEPSPALSQPFVHNPETNSGIGLFP